MVRDGRAVLASVLPLDWGPHNVRSAAAAWVEAIAHGLAAESAHPSKVLRVHYEMLLSAPRASLERICEFLDVKFELQMVKADGFSVPNVTRQQHALVGSPPDVSRLTAWEKSLTARQVELFEFYAGNLLEHLHYAPIHGAEAVGPTRRERWLMSIEDIVLPYRRRARYKRRYAMAHRQTRLDDRVR